MERKPIEQRIVYRCRPIDSDPYIQVKVDKDTWRVQPILYTFTKRIMETFHRGRIVKTKVYTPQVELCNYDLENLSKKLSWLKPEISQRDLYKLFQHAIKQGVSTYASEDNLIIRIGLTVDTWLKYEDKHKRSKWIAVLPNTVQSAVRNQPIQPI